jgi:hypothetical protein
VRELRKVDALGRITAGHCLLLAGDEDELVLQAGDDQLVLVVGVNL